MHTFLTASYRELVPRAQTQPFCSGVVHQSRTETFPCMREFVAWGLAHCVWDRKRNLGRNGVSADGFFFSCSRGGCTFFIQGSRLGGRDCSIILFRRKIRIRCATVFYVKYFPGAHFCP
jgi:hypothetical protein